LARWGSTTSRRRRCPAATWRRCSGPSACCPTPPPSPRPGPGSTTSSTSCTPSGPSFTGECPCTLQPKSLLFIPRKEIARPQSRFPHLCVCERSRSQVGLRSLVSAHAHCNQNPIYVFPEKEWRAASVPIFPTFMVVCERFIYVPTIAIHW
jgi:hypothetical protein